MQVHRLQRVIKTLDELLPEFVEPRSCGYCFGHPTHLSPSNAPVKPAGIDHGQLPKTPVMGNGSADVDHPTGLMPSLHDAR